MTPVRFAFIVERPGLAKFFAVLLILAGVGFSGCIGNPPPNAPPTARIWASTTMPEVSQSIQFDGGNSTDDRGIVGYEWEFGDGAQAQGSKTSHAYPSPGSYMVKLKVTDSDRSTGTDQLVIKVAVPPKNIGAACVKTNATAYKCAITSADAGVDFQQVSVQLVAGAGTVVCSFTAPLALGSSCTAASPAGSGRHTDNGDGAFGLGDDFYFAPLYVPTATSLVGLTFKLEGGGAIGQAPLN